MNLTIKLNLENLTMFLNEIAPPPPVGKITYIPDCLNSTKTYQEIFYQVFSSKNLTIYFLLLCIPSLFWYIWYISETDFLYVDDDEPVPQIPRDYKEVYETVKDNTEFNVTVAAAAAAAPSDENNSLEQENLWKSRVLMIYDEKRGNIIMNYDLYKQAFTYYCDMNYIPYEVLNEIARRYVVTYRCISFFVPDDAVSNTSEESATAAAPVTISAPLTKNYSVNTIANRFGKAPTAAAAAPAQKKEAETPEKLTNRFVRSGKICDFKFLKIPPKKEVEKKQNITYSSFRTLFS